MRKKFLLMLTLLIIALGGSGKLFAQVAKVGNTTYATIDEAIKNWTDGTTLTLLADVTLSDVIKLNSDEYHILDLGTHTMKAKMGSGLFAALGHKDAIEIVNKGRKSASYALDIKADANNPGGITVATGDLIGNSVVKTTGKSGVQDRPIIRFYGGVFNGSNIVSHSGSNGTNCPQFWFYGGEFNGTISANRAKFIFYGGTFNGNINISVDSSADALVCGGKFKKLSNSYDSTLNTDKFTIGSAAGVYDRGIYVDKDGYYVITSEVIKEVSAKYPAVKKESYNSNNYFYYSAAATYGMFYEVASMAGTGSNVTIWEKPAVTIPETLTGDVVDEIANNTALKEEGYAPTNLPAGAELEIKLKSVDGKFVFDVTPMANGAEVEPTEAITFRLPVPASVTKAFANVYHEGTLMGIYEIKGEGSAKYVEIASADFSEFAVEPTTNPAAKIGEVYYATFADALTAANAMNGDVTVEIYEEVTLNGALTGNYASIKFVGLAEAAEIYLDIQGYSEAAGKKVAFENLKLSKVAGGYITNAGFMNLAFGIYGATETTYTDCTFVNGAYASTGNVTFTGCTFYRSHDRYGLWAYGNVDITVDGCTFPDIRGIKMYAEGQGQEGAANLTVKNTDFTEADNKPAIVLTYGESVTLVNNTYSSTGVFELDLDGKPNGVAVTSDVAPTCVNDNGACGVLVDGKIYTTVAQAAEVATSGSTVTLLHNSAETVALPMGVTLNKNNFEAAGVTVAVPVAKIGDVEYATLAAAVEAAQAGDEIVVIANFADVTVDVTKNLTISGAATLNNVGINANGADALTVKGLSFTGNSWINSGTAEALTVSGVTATVAPSNASYTNSRSAFISLGRSEGQELALTLENNNITVTSSGPDAVLGWAKITAATITGNVIKGSNDGYFTNADAIKFMAIANGAEFVVNNNEIYSNYNGIVFAQNTTRDNAYSVSADANKFYGGADHIWIEISGGNTVHATVNAKSKNKVNGNAFAVGDIKYHSGVIKNWTSYAGVDVVTDENGKVIGGTLASYSNAESVAEGYEIGAGGVVGKASVAEVNGTKYTSIEDAIAAANAGDEIVMLADVTLDAETTLPAGIIFNGNGKQINGSLVAAGNLTFKGMTKVTSFNAGYNKPVITIGEGACLEMNGTGRMVIGHGCTFNITGTIADNAAKTTDKATLTPSLVMPGASFTGAGVTFNVTNAYISAPSSYCSSSKSASGTFDFNITNSIWENAGKLAFESQSTAATVNFDLKNSVLNTGSHLVFGVSRGEIVVDNSNVNVGKSNQIENQSTMTIKNGSVVNGAVATSSNAKNPGTVIVENATYAVTGEFSGSDLGTGTLIIKKGATVSAGSITKANITIDAEGMTASDAINLTANLSKLAGTLSVINNDKLEAKIVDGKVVLVAKPVAKIGEQGYATLNEAFAAATEGQTITLLADATPTLKSQRAITKAAVIDLDGKTLTLTEDDLYFGTTTFQNGTIVVDPSVKPSTAVFWMFANQTLTFDAVKVVATGVTGTYLIGLDGNNSDLNLINGSEILVENTTALDLDIICVNASTGNDIKVENSKVNVTNLDGRVFFRGNYTVSGTSEVNLEGITKAGFRIEAGQTLTIADNAIVNIVGEPRDGGIHLTDLSATYTKAETATVNATVNEPKVAKVGENTYRTLAQAVAAVEDGGTITLIANETFTKNNRTLNTGTWYDGLYYVGDKSFTIDLGGFTIGQDGSVNDYLLNFKNSGSKANTITLKNGTVDAGTAAFCALCTSSSQENQLTINTENLALINNISNGSTVKLRGGAILNVKEGTVITGKNSYLGIECVASTVNIYDGAKIYMNGTSSYNGCLVGACAAGTVNVYGGYGKGVKGGFIAMTSGGTINIEGGEWIANTDGTVGNNSNLYVLTAQSNKNESGFAGPSIINVTGGTFRGGMDAWVLNNHKDEKAELNISGGNFNAKPTSYVAEDYIAVENNGVWNVVKAAAKIDKQGYATIKDAVAAVKESETITILAGTHSEGTIKLPATLKNVTLKGVEGAILKDMTISAADGNSYSYVNLTFDGITFDNSRLLFTGWRNGEETIENLTVTNCTFKNLYDTTNTAPVHINKEANEPVNGFTFTNNVIDGATGGSKSGIYAQVTGDVKVENNIINNVSFRPYVIQVTTDDGIADNFTVKGNTFSGSAAGRAQGLGNNAEGTDDVTLVVSNNIFKNITNSQQICYWNFNAEKTTADLSGNYYDIDIVANPGKIYYNAAAANIGDLVIMDIFPIYTALNEDGTINLNSAFTVNGVSTKAELNAAIASAEEGATIVMIADIDYGTDQLKIEKDITLDLGGKTLTTRNAYGGMSVKNNPTVKNGNIVHASNTAAIKVWNATAFEDLVIDVQGKGDANKTIGGIVLQSGSTTRVGLIKNVTIKGAALTNGIETYNCGDATENVIGAMENVAINAQGTGMLISAPCGTATNCSISGGTNGIEIWIKGNYSASLNLVGSTVEGGVYAHDEFSSNPGIVNNGTLSLTADNATTGAGVEDVTLTIARAENLEGVIEDVMEAAQAKIGDTYYTTIAKAIKAAQAGQTVTILEGTYAMPSMKAGITVEGQGNVLFEGTLSGTLENLTMKNIHIKGANAQRWAYAKGNLVFENVTFEATSVYALHFDGIAEGTNLTYTNCTIIGWAAMGGSPASCIFDGCTIKDNGTYGVIRTYFDATIQNCTFDVANVNTNDAYQDGIHAVDGAYVTVTGCTNNNGDMIDLVNIHALSIVKLDRVEIKNVVKTNGNYYRTLAEAFAAVGVGNGKTVELIRDVDLASAEWTPVDFNGVFDGQNHTISNLVVNGAGKSNQGFFGTTQNGEIKNVTFNNAKVTGRLNVGVVAGQPYTSKYTNVEVTGHVEVNGYAYVGGVGGKNAYANWTDITVNVDETSYVKADSENYRTYVGGVVGFNGEGGHTFKNISSNIKVIGSTCDIGGIFGIAHYNNKFENITFTGAVEASADAEEVGGIAGVWHNQVGTSVTFTNCTSEEGTVTICGETTTGSIVGGAYNAANETEENSGSLIIDGVEAWLKVAQVGEVKYLTLAKAVAAVTENTTITMLADVELTSTVTVAKGQVVTLNLNGKTISAAITEQLTKSFAAIQNRGTLTVKDSATTRAAGKITVSYAGNTFGYGVGLYTISNEGGVLNIESGIVENTTTVSGSMYDAIDNNSTLGKTVLNITGGEVRCPGYIGVRQFANSTTHENIVNVTGGKVVGGNTSIWMQNPGSNQPKATIAISGDANIEGRLLADTSTGFTFNVTGGTFTVDPSAYLSAEFDAIETNGTWVVKQVSGTQTRSFQAGWNWFSSYVDLSQQGGLGKLQTAISNSGLSRLSIEVKGQTVNQSVQYGYMGTIDGEDIYGWTGKQDWNPYSNKMYMIKTSDAISAADFELSGDFVDYENTTIALLQGWNWISYPINEPTLINEALKGLVATEGDKIKFRGNTYAEYFDGEWFPEDFVFEPGQGYMYEAKNPTSFVYSKGSGNTSSIMNNMKTVENNHWTPSMSEYANNMTITAMLSIEGEYADDSYEVAAFANGECRGSVRPVYVERLNAYMIFLTVYGDEVEEMTFKCYDTNNDREYTLSNVVVYSNDAVLGSIREPYIMTCNTMGIDEATISNIHIYPNPTTTDREINLQATCDKVEVFNTLGVKVAEYQNVDTIDALETAGTYVIRVTLNGDVKHCRLVVK